MNKLTLLLATVAMIASVSVAQATEPQAEKPNYELAERFSPTKVRRAVPQTIVRPNWFKASNKFWYKWQSVDAVNYYIVDVWFIYRVPLKFHY